MIRKALFSLTLLFLCSWIGQSWATMDVSVSIPPQKWMCEKLGEGLLNVHVLVEGGEDPHAFEPQPGQVSALAKSRMYFTLGLEFEKNIIQKLKQTTPNLQIVDTAKGVVAEAEHGEHHHDHGHLEDQHIWLSPESLIAIAENMSNALIAEDAANTAQYEINLEALIKELTQFHEELSSSLAPHRGAAIYVFHPSFGHFAKSYGLKQVALEVDGKAPTPKQLSGLIKQARKDRAKVIFVQPQFDTQNAKTLAAAIEAEVVPLDPLAEDVMASMHEMGEKFSQSLQQSVK